MHIACFHAGMVQANVAEALSKYAPEVEFVDTSGDRYEYGRAIASRWDKGDDLVIIEHDNEITKEVISSFTLCSELWCTFGYEIFSPPWTRICVTGLGCVKFSAQLQRDFDFDKYVVKAVCDYCGNAHSDWGSLDVRTSSSLNSILGISEPHVHGRIRHFHPYQAVDPADFTDKHSVVKLYKSEFRKLNPGEKLRGPDFDFRGKNSGCVIDAHPIYRVNDEG